MPTLAACLILLLSVTAMPLRAAEAPVPVQKVILDTDIGDDIDDAYALALVTSLPEANIIGVTTTFRATDKRAELAAKLLSVMGRPDIPVYPGRRTGNGIGRQYEWASGFRSPALKNDAAADFMAREIARAPGEITLIGIGALTNIGDLLKNHPEARGAIRRIVIMGGSVYTGYNNQAPPTPEWNIRCDPAAARTVFTSGVPLTMAGLEVTSMMQLDGERQKRIFATGVPTTDALAALTNLWGGGTPTLYDPVAAAYAFGHSFCESEQRCVEVGDDGSTRIVDGAPNVTVLVRPNKNAFLDWYVSAVKQRSTRP